MTESDIIHEVKGCWVSRHGREKRKRYDVNKNGAQVSNTVQSFAFNEDGKSCAIAYCDYLASRVSLQSRHA